ncbi:MAG: cytochrome c peroxidase [Armatimonadota bacterium]
MSAGMRVRLISLAIAVLTILVLVQATSAADLTNKELLGKFLFFDTNLSSPPGQSCASCHDPDFGFADPDHNLPVSQGAIQIRVGNRNAPTVTYLATAPDFTYDPDTGASKGGQFWDGRAFDLVEQAKGPFLNPVEMHNPNKKLVIHDIQKADYAPLFKKVYGKNIFNNVENAYNAMADAIAEFEKSPELNRFDSKLDYYLRVDKSVFTDQEKLGMEIFQGKGHCLGCHAFPVGSTEPILTAFGYANIGVPINPDNPFYTTIPSINPDDGKIIDLGLGGFLQTLGLKQKAYEDQYGKMGMPTVRNIALTAPYFHNGVFNDLHTVVHFFNTRDVTEEHWPSPEVKANVSTVVGNLGLTETEEEALVAFLMTLTDGYKP